MNSLNKNLKFKLMINLIGEMPRLMTSLNGMHLNNRTRKANLNGIIRRNKIMGTNNGERLKKLRVIIMKTIKMINNKGDISKIIGADIIEIRIIEEGLIKIDNKGVDLTTMIQIRGVVLIGIKIIEEALTMIDNKEEGIIKIINREEDSTRIQIIGVDIIRIDNKEVVLIMTPTKEVVLTETKIIEEGSTTMNNEEVDLIEIKIIEVALITDKIKIKLNLMEIIISEINPINLMEVITDLIIIKIPNKTITITKIKIDLRITSKIEIHKIIRTRIKTTITLQSPGLTMLINNLRKGNRMTSNLKVPGGRINLILIHPMITKIKNQTGILRLIIILNKITKNKSLLTTNLLKIINGNLMARVQIKKLRKRILSSRMEGSNNHHGKNLKVIIKVKTSRNFREIIKISISKSLTIIMGAIIDRLLKIIKISKVLRRLVGPNLKQIILSKIILILRKTNNGLRKNKRMNLSKIKTSRIIRLKYGVKNLVNRNKVLGAIKIKPRREIRNSKRNNLTFIIYF